MAPSSPIYVVITPARNEAAGIEDTILRMAAQTIRPAQWIIVNDGSTDSTGSIIDDYARKYSWITAVHRSDRGYRSPGGGVIDAVMEGYRHIHCSGWEFVVKFDADMSPEADYFEKCLAVFRAEPRLGVGGGTVYQLTDGKPEVDSNPAFHVRGATKIYRRGCWDGLGGLLAAPGWDTLDEVKANMLGWETRTFTEIRVLQRRPTGSNDGAWRDCVKNGRADYICGYHPFFMLLKSARRLFQKPYVTGSLGHLWGYVGGYLHGVSRVNDPALIAYLRQQQMRRIFGMKTIWT